MVKIVFTCKAEVTVSAMVTIFFSLLLAGFVGWFIYDYLNSSSDQIFSLTNIDCTPLDKQKSIDSFYNDIARYGAVRTPEGQRNNYFEPEYAVEYFNKYLACKDANLFTPEQLLENNEKIVAAGRVAYLNYATHVCETYGSLASASQGGSGSNQQIRELRAEYLEQYESLSEDYYRIFRNSNNRRLETPSVCNQLYS